jgi:phosphoribosyl-ATP pyrophosphohydrolase
MTTPRTPPHGNDTLARLAAVIESRRLDQGGDPAKSYVSRLFAKGPDAVLKKIGEEATELVMACKDGEPVRIVAETADLWFHSMVALAAHGLSPADVLAELERREGLSGLDEFALRKVRERERERGVGRDGEGEGVQASDGQGAPPADPAPRSREGDSA